MKNSFYTISTLSATLLLIVSSLLWAAPNDDIAERLKPVGSICKVGEACAKSVASSADPGPREAGNIYQTGCLACHQTGAADAPKMGDSIAWASRLTKGIDALYNNAYKGINGMPAKGLCADCSEDEIRATVDYILEQSK